MPPKQAPSARSASEGMSNSNTGAADVSARSPAQAPAAKRPASGYKNASELVKVYELFSDENIAARIRNGDAAAAIAADYARMMAPALQKARTKDAREITKFDIAQSAAEEARAIYNEEDQVKLKGRPLVPEEQAELKRQYDEEFNRRAAKALQLASAFAKSAWGKDLEDGGPREVPPQDMQPQEEPPETSEFASIKSVAGFGDAKAADRSYDVPAADDKIKKTDEAKAKIKKGIEAWAGSRKETK